jgi:hypothetical protein
MENILLYRDRVICVHNANVCPDENAKSYLSYETELSFGKSARTYRARTQEIKEKLVEQMRIEGLVNLGRRLKEFMDKTGEHI